MQAISTLAFIPFRSYRRTNLVYKNFEGLQFPCYASTDMGLCMHVDILMNFMRAKLQMAT